MLRLHAFGVCFLEQDGRRLDAISGQRKALALLLVLAAAGERGVTRDTLVAYFWPESDDEHARTSLRQLVHALRSQLHEPELLLPSPELRLNPQVITSDVIEFQRALDAGSLDAAIELYVGPLADGFFLSGADSFERWLSTERENLAHRASSAVETLAEHAAARGDGAAAVRLWRRLIQIAPLSARATVGLMRALDSIGERGAALQHARVHEALVRQDLGGTLDPSVTQMAAELRNPAPATKVGAQLGSAAATTVASAYADRGLQSPRSGMSRHRQFFFLSIIPIAIIVAVIGWQRWQFVVVATKTAQVADAASRNPSIAVLPFVNTSGSPLDEPLSDGLTDELIGALAKVHGLRVTGRTSAFVFKTRKMDLRRIADTLGVASVLEGSLRRTGSRLKVNAQLVSARDGGVIWAEQYDGELKDLIDMQEKISRAIVGALRVTLVRSTSVGITRKPPRDIRAYELYLRGRHIFTTRTNRDAALQAERYFNEALSLDSTYASAYAGLADVYLRLGVFGFDPTLNAYAKAKTAARHALAIDSTVAEAHATLAHALCVADFDWQAAEREFRHAIALNPNYVFARIPFAICLIGQGRLAEGAAQLDTARSLDPLAPAVSNVLGRMYVGMQRPDDAIRHLHQALELSPQLDLAYQQLGHAYLQKGMKKEAIASLQRAAALSGPRDSAHLAYVYAAIGERADAERIVRSLVARPPHRLLPYHIAMVYAGLGQKDEAFRWLNRAYEERASFMVGVNVDPPFHRLRSDPRWRVLQRKMGFLSN